MLMRKLVLDLKTLEKSSEALILNHLNLAYIGKQYCIHDYFKIEKTLFDLDRDGQPRFPDAESLHLKFCKFNIDKSFDQSMNSLINLKSLKLERVITSRNGDESITTVWKLPNLKCLELYFDFSYCDIPWILRKLNSIRSLDYLKIFVIGIVPLRVAYNIAKFIKNQEKLTELDLTVHHAHPNQSFNNIISEIRLPVLKKFKIITSCKDKFGDLGYNIIENSKETLQEVSIYMYNHKFEILRILFNESPKLKKLSVKFNTYYTYDTLLDQELSKLRPNYSLESLCIDDQSTTLPARFWNYVLPNMIELDEINFTCFKFDDSSYKINSVKSIILKSHTCRTHDISKLMEMFPNLEDLRIECLIFNRPLSNADLLKTLTNCTKLRKLQIPQISPYCIRIKSLIKLLQNCPRLKTVEIPDKLLSDKEDEILFKFVKQGLSIKYC